MITLRPYQLNSVARIVAATDPLVVAPTGSGKTVIVAEVIRRVENKFMLVLAHRRELIHQMRDKLARVRHHRWRRSLAGKPMNQMARVQVASIQTLWSRCLRGKMDLPPADLLVIDEAHHARQTYRKIIDRYPDAVVLGLTATPCRRDGRGLGGIFETMIESPQVAELIRLGFLVPTRIYAPIAPDLTGVHTWHGDYVESELAERMDRPKLVGDIVTHWHNYGERRKTVAFAVGRALDPHPRRVHQVRRALRAHRRLDAQGRARRNRSPASPGEIEVVTNCMVLTEGWDMPEVGCCILARPTKKMGLYRQMVGRVLRPAPRQDRRDHARPCGAVFRHGFVEDPVEWTLDPDRPNARTHAPTREQHGSRLLECTQCGAVRVAGEACPLRVLATAAAAPGVAIRDGELGLVDRARHANSNTYDPAERQRWHAMLIWIASERGYKPGVAAHRYRDRFGHWPQRTWSFFAAVQPTPEVIAWDRHCRIKFAKSRQKAGAGA